MVGGRWPVAKKTIVTSWGQLANTVKPPAVISTWCEQDLFAVQGSSEFRSFPHLHELFPPIMYSVKWLASGH